MFYSVDNTIIYRSKKETFMVTKDSKQTVWKILAGHKSRLKPPYSLKCPAPSKVYCCCLCLLQIITIKYINNALLIGDYLESNAQLARHN